MAACLPVLALLGWLLLGAPGSGAAWPIGLTVLMAAGLILALGLLGVLLRGWRHPVQQAVVQLQRRDPAVAEGLRAVFGLQRSAENGASARAFVRCHEAQVWARLADYPASRVVPYAPLGRLYRLLGLGAVVGAAALFLLPGAPGRLVAQLGLPGGPHELPDLAADLDLAQVNLVVRPPRYTGLPVVVVGLRRGAAVPAGSLVTLKVEAKRPLQAVRIALPGGRIVPAELTGERSFRVRFVARAGEIRLALKPRGAAWQVPVRGLSLRVRPDRAPSLSVSPADPILNQRKAGVIPLRFEASDDYGLVEVRLVYTTDRGRSGLRVLARGPRFGSQRRRTLAQTHRWDLARLGLTAGREVRFHLEARDNRTGQGAAGKAWARTAEQRLRITAPPSSQQRLLQQLKRLMERAVHRLADRLERQPPTNRTACQALLRFVHAALAKEGRLAADLARVTRVAAKSGGLPDLLRRSVEQELAPLARRLTRAVRSARPACGRQTRSKVASGLEELVLLLDELLGRAVLERLHDLARRITALERKVRRLAEQLQRQPSETLRKQYQDRLAELSALLGEFQRQSAELRDDLVDEHLNRYALRGRGLGDLLGRLDRARPATDDLKRLRRRVERLKNGLAQGLDSFRKYYPRPGEPSRRGAARRVAGLARTQRRLQSGQGRPPGRAARQLRLAGRAAQLGRQLQQRGARDAARLLQEAARHMQHAARALARRRATEAARHGQRALQVLERARRALENQGRLTRPGQAGSDGTGERAGRVDVPPAGGALPQQLRQQILDAGRSTWPRRYRRAIKRYYERLLR